MITFTRSWRGYAAGTSVSTLADTIEALAVAEGAAVYGGVSLPPGALEGDAGLFERFTSFFELPPKAGVA